MRLFCAKSQRQSSVNRWRWHKHKEWILYQFLSIRWYKIKLDVDIDFDATCARASPFPLYLQVISEPIVFDFIRIYEGPDPLLHTVLKTSDFDYPEIEITVVAFLEHPLSQYCCQEQRHDSLHFKTPSTLIYASIFFWRLEKYNINPDMKAPSCP